MFRKLIILVGILAALMAAGFGLAVKDDVLKSRHAAQYHTAMKTRNFGQAYSIANQLAADGYMPGHYFLGVLYEEGKGVEQNSHIAFEQFKLAAVANDGQAQVRLGRVYLHGEGVAPNEKLAVYWFEKAAANGFPSAQYELGRLYKSGISVMRDPEKAQTLLQSAAAQGILEANIDLADLTAGKLGLR